MAVVWWGFIPFEHQPVILCVRACVRVLASALLEHCFGLRVNDVVSVRVAPVPGAGWTLVESQLLPATLYCRADTLYFHMHTEIVPRVS